jgi:hypothetical protein
VLQKHGFRTVIKPGIELHVQDVVALNFEMQIGSAAESTTEVEGAPLVQAESAMLGQTIDHNMLQDPLLILCVDSAVRFSPDTTRRS